MTHKKIAQQALTDINTDDGRVQLLHAWLTKVLGVSDYSFTTASSDASFRRYFRVGFEAAP